MKEIKQVLIATALLLVLPIIAFAVSGNPPAIPLLVYGGVTIDGNSAPVGAEILAEIDGVRVTAAKISIAGRYFIEVPDGKVNEGKMITFKVNGIVNNLQLKCANIDTIPSINFNLAVVTPAPASTPVSAPASSGGGGGGSYTYVPATTPSTSQLSEEAKKVDANKDGKIDVLDFNTLMVNWGNTSDGNVADFNGDGKVDVFDFNLLMINWTL